jgi:hypothetical protein
MLDKEKLEQKLMQFRDEAKVHMDQHIPHSVEWSLWEWRYDTYDSVLTMIRSGAYDAQDPHDHCAYLMGVRSTRSYQCGIERRHHDGRAHPFQDPVQERHY